MNKRFQVLGTGIFFVIMLLFYTTTGRVESAVELEHILPALTGGFGEESCYSCHFDGPLNSPRGKVTMQNLPERFESEKEYELSVVIEYPVMSNAGFQLAARNANGIQAGSFITTEQRVTVTEHRNVQYVHHTYDGTSLVSEDINIWHLLWKAPASEKADTVYFHVAAVAGNGDQTRHGDNVFEKIIVVNSK